MNPRSCLKRNKELNPINNGKVFSRSGLYLEGHTLLLVATRRGEGEPFTAKSKSSNEVNLSFTTFSFCK